MARVLEARGSDGAVCISDGTPGCLDNPLGHLPNVFFHSSLAYLSVRQVVDTSISTGSGTGTETHTLFAHGAGASPLVAGVITSTGQPLVGTTAVQSDNCRVFKGLTLAADDTNVSVHVLKILANASSYNLRVFVFDQVFTGSPPGGDPAETLYADPTTFRASAGKLNSARRYIQRAPLDAQFVLAGGLTYYFYTSTRDNHGAWTYQCCGYHVAGVQHVVAYGWAGVDPVPQAATLVGVAL